MQVNPRARRLAREKAIQYLFGLGFTDTEPDAESLASFWEAFPSKPGVRDYAEKLIEGARARQETLDTHIDGALKNWTASRVGRVERNILRVALFEMALCDDVPEKVAINEAIDMAKLLGGDDSPRFVNGVLDRLKGVELGESSD